MDAEQMKATITRQVAAAYDVPMEMLVGKETPVTDPIEGCPDCGGDVELDPDDPTEESVQCANPRCGWRP